MTISDSIFISVLSQSAIISESQLFRSGLAASAVQRVKQRRADIRMYLVLAYHPSERPIDLWGGFDGSYYLPLENTPRQYTIVKANQYMADTTDFMICYVKHVGNARNLLEYVQKRKADVHIQNLAAEF